MVNQTLAVFLAAEVKRPGKVATNEQSDFLSAVRASGGAALLVSSIDELQEGLHEYIDKLRGSKI